MPDDYFQMMQKCWDVDPSKRPTIGELFKFAKNKLKEIIIIVISVVVVVVI